jgi:DNA recombination protein RmuC
MEMEILQIIILGLLLMGITLILFRRTKSADLKDFNSKFIELNSAINEIESHLKDDFKANREETTSIAKQNRDELSVSLKDFRQEVGESQKGISDQNSKAFDLINGTIELKIEKLIIKQDENERSNREALVKSLKEFTDEVKAKFNEIRTEQKNLTDKTVEQLEKVNLKVEERLTAITEQDKVDNAQMRDALVKAFKDFQDIFDKNVKSFNDLQKEKFGQLETKQSELIVSTEKKLEQMRETVDEKLQKTLNERLGQSFETVGKQLEAVQLGLGEMKSLALDVGGLKKVLSNVKQRGGVGEIQLEMLLEQILAPDQYEANVRTKAGSADSVEFAIKLPGRDDNQTNVYLPIDAKFPKDAYEQLVDAYESSDPVGIEAANKTMEAVIKKMAKDIRDKYLDPPHTTDFAIMFLPFEGIYAEVIRRSYLLEQLQREFKIVVTGPTTLAAILNSLQMGFRTLALQKRSSEVWSILGAVKTEFEKFGGLLEKAQKHISSAGETIELLQGTRTKAINRKLKEVQSLPANETAIILPEMTPGDTEDDETENI